MKSFHVGMTSTILGLATFFLATGAPTPADARPKYRETFAEKYPGLAEEVKKVKCGVCHPPGAAEKMKVRNNYGQALEKVLGAKNVSDKEAILKALTTIESEKSATEGQSFGDLIKAGTLPGKNE